MCQTVPPSPPLPRLQNEEIIHHSEVYWQLYSYIYLRDKIRFFANEKACAQSREQASISSNATSDRSDSWLRGTIADYTHPISAGEHVVVGKFSTWYGLNKNITAWRFLDVGRNRPFAQSRHLNSPRCLIHRKISSRARSLSSLLAYSQEDGRYVSVGMGVHARKTRIYVGAERTKKREREGQTVLMQMRLYRVPGNRQISGTGQYRPFSTVREHSNIARQWRRMGDSCLTLALARSYDSLYRSRGKFLTTDFR